MNKNLRDINNTVTPYQDTNLNIKSFMLSYSKTNKLITGLYMVTDIMDKEEPIRNRLRTLGIEILSDTTNISKTLLETSKIDQVLSFLSIASAMNFISEMNHAILKKEFLELKGSINEYTEMKPKWLGEFLGNSPLEGWSKIGVDKIPPPPPKGYSSRGELKHKGHQHNSNGHSLRTRIGVQKASTLMQALSDKIASDKKDEILLSGSHFKDFELIKQERRNNIIKIIEENGGNSNIKDIFKKINIEGSNQPLCSEKTLQRELVSMIKDNVLNKTGDKRWSRYFVKN